MKTPLLLASIASAALAATLTAGPADDIAAKHAAASAKELEDYIAKNPDAEDKSAAVDHLLAAWPRLDARGKRRGLKVLAPFLGEQSVVAAVREAA